MSDVKVLFFQPAIGKQYGIISIGLLSLATYLQNHGHDSRIVVLADRDTDETIKKKIKEFNPKIACISFHWYIHSFEAIKIATSLKKADPDIKVVVGGHSSTYFNKQILDFTPNIDLIIKGDGEKPLLDYVSTLKPETVENASFIKDGSIISKPLTYRQITLDNVSAAKKNMNELVDEWDKYINTKRIRTSAPISSNTIVEEIETRPNEFYLYVGKGCNFNCCFCGASKSGNSRIFRRGMAIFRPLNEVIEDANMLKNNGVESLFIDFGPFKDETYFHKLFDRLKPLEMDVVYLPWNLPSNEIISKISKSFKNFEIQISPDTGSERLREELFHKGFHREFYSNSLLEKSIDKVAEVGASRSSQLFLWFICGLPFESKQDYQDTIDFSISMKKCHPQLFKNLQDQLNCVPLRLTPEAPIDLFPEKFKMKKLRSNFKDYYEYCQDLEKGTIIHPLGLERDDLSESEIIKRAINYKNKILAD